MASIRGGEKLERYLAEMTAKLEHYGTLRVGFLEGATYVDGTPVALIAAIQNYGAPLANIPARPFFSNMVDTKQKEWGPALAKLLQSTSYDTIAALNLMGEGIKGQLQQAIRDFVGVPLAPATIARKGFDKQLIDTSHMLNSVSYAVEEV